MTDTDQPLDADDDLDSALRAWGRQQRAVTRSAPAPRAHLSPSRARPGRRWLLPSVAAAVVVTVAVAGVVARQLLPEDQPARQASSVAVLAVDQVRPHLTQAALTRPLTLGDGTLRLDPPTAPTSVNEAKALALWRSGSSGLGGSSSIWLTGVVITRADITLTLPVTDQGPVRPAHPATFDHRTGWVVLSEPGQAACPAHTPTPTAPVDASPPPALSVWLLSGDGTDAIDYSSAGVGLCGGRQPVPQARASGFTSTTRPAAGSSVPTTCASRGNTVDGVTYAFTLLAPDPCTGGDLGPTLGLGPLVVSIITDPSGPFTYYDGTTHRQP